MAQAPIRRKPERLFAVEDIAHEVRGQKRKVDHLLDTPLSDVFSACDLAKGPVGSLVNTPVSSIRLIVSA
ncbi:hypothetical protein JT55_16630 [Rhodovulum sp. NI22]|nr:hypothetical protein JT55_16630 [Rhodovulum sp. NI22]